MICLVIKKLPFEILKNAVREIPAKLDEMTLLKVRLWLVLDYFRNFGTAGGNFPLSGREFPVAPREWKVGKRRSRGLLQTDGIGSGGKWEGRGREEREKKGRGAACPNNKMSFPCPGQ